MITELLNFLNPIFWVGANFLIIYIGIALLIFVAAYYFLFDPSATTGGKLIFRFKIALLGIMALVFIGVWVNPREGAEWFQYQVDTMIWRPFIRFAVYSYVAWSISHLAVFLWIRKFRPWKLKTSEENLVKTRDSEF